MGKQVKSICFFLLFLMCICFITGCTSSQQEKDSETDQKQEQTETTPDEDENQSENPNEAEEEPVESAFLPHDQKIERQVEETLSKMTLEEKIGQLIVVGFSSTKIDSHIKTMIQDYNVGGVILYDRNMESPAQVAQLSKDLQGLAAENNVPIPLMMSIDQEGGEIVRMRDKVADKPSQQELGENADSDAIYETNLQTGKELQEMGIQVNYAPVLDLSATDSRSFGENPNQAAEFGMEAIKGLNDSGITATLKHFPGNGRSDVDPHYDSSEVEADQMDLENNDIFPFKKVIDKVDHNQFFVMVTHLKYPAYDEENPASLSPVIIQELLREKLGYQGIVVTDDLEMGAVNQYYTYQDLGYNTVNAGADLLLVCHKLESQSQVIEGIRDAVETDQLTEERIDESVKRILTYKFEMGL